MPAGTLECCKKKALEYSGIVLPAARLSKQVPSSAPAVPCRFFMQCTFSLTGQTSNKQAPAAGLVVCKVCAAVASQI